jgi:K+/H+ antiporter YhaU regulatory subunit KhtT
VVAVIDRGSTQRTVPSGGYVVRHADGQAIAYVYSRDNEAEARQAKVLTKDEARRIAINVARLPDLARAEVDSGLAGRLTAAFDK